MVKIKIGSGHGSSKMDLKVDVSKDSLADISVGAGYDNSVRSIEFIERSTALALSELDLLRQRLDDAMAVLPAGPDAERLKMTAESFAKTASTAIKERKWYSVSADGLLDAAKTLGETVSPVTGSALKVIELLQKLSR